MSILVQNFIKRWFRSKFLKNFDIGKILENLYFGQHFCKIPILVQIFINSEFGRFWLSLRKMLILVKKKWKYVDICQNSRKSRFCSEFSKISILVRIDANLDFGKNCRKISSLINIFGKISILVNFLRDFDLSEKKYKNFGLGKNFRKMSIWVKICKYQDFGPNFQKISIWVKILKILIWSHFVKKCRFGSKFANIKILVWIYKKISILVKILKILIWSHFVENSQMWYKFSKNIDYGQNYQ